MVKQLIISPAEVRQTDTVTLGTIPVNHYRRTLADELATGVLTPADALRLYRDMVLVREFETMLDEIKRQGKYRDVAYVHQGPAHLSIGQEAAAVGEAFLLTVDDHIFGSHRSHGEILAKGLAAIHQLNETDLQRIMESYLGGDTLRVVEKEPARDGKERAIHYLLYGLLAEIFARATGFNRGLGGSMHAFFPPSGSIPTTPSWAAAETSPWARPWPRRRSGSPGSRLPTSETHRPAAARSGKGCTSRPWGSTGPCGSRPTGAACPSSSPS